MAIYIFCILSTKVNKYTLSYYNTLLNNCICIIKLHFARNFDIGEMYLKEYLMKQ